jgi:2-iminobutanoate/2-iminopropanoate deaminase
MTTSLSDYLVISRGQWDEHLSPDQIQEAIDRFYAWHDGLVAAGRMKTGQRLAVAGKVVTRQGVMDGPFTEAKELVGGYWFFVAASLEEAAALAAQNPCLACGLTFEVRPIEHERASAFRASNESPALLAKTGARLPRDIVFTSEAPKPPPTYSQAVRAAGLVFVSGTGPQDPVTGAITGATIQEQTRQCLTNISAILAAAGTSLDKVVSATVIVLEEGDFAGMNEEWVRWFPVDPPARQGAKLPVRVPGMKISIAVIATA